MKCVVLVLALTACDAGTTHVSPVKSADVPQAVTADAAIVVADASVAVDEPEYWLEGYFVEPRISGDGKHVLLAVVDDDGARAAQNLALEIRDRRDRVEARVVLLAIDEELRVSRRAPARSAHRAARPRGVHEGALHEGRRSNARRPSHVPHARARQRARGHGDRAARAAADRLDAVFVFVADHRQRAITATIIRRSFSMSASAASMSSRVPVSCWSSRATPRARP